MLLLFVTESCKILGIDMPCVTFDQQLYVKAFEIASPSSQFLFVLEDSIINKLLGSIGKAMEGSGLETAFENAYKPVTASYIFS